MLLKVVSLSVSLLLYSNVYVDSKKLDFKVLTAVRHGLETSLEYIDRNLNDSNVDCVLGVAFVRAFMSTAYKNGSHIMDNSSLRLLFKSNQIIGKGRAIFKDNVRNGNNWKFKYLVDSDIWIKNIKYRENGLLPVWKKLNYLVQTRKTLSYFPYRKNSDTCLQEIVNSTRQVHEIYIPCVVSIECWNAFFRNGKGQGYYLTHKLLLLQIAKARKCWLNKKFYEKQIRDICSSIMSEIVNFSHKNIDQFFDLFLEQVLLCGYEGFTEFIQNDWLFRILKSQRFSGCFSDILNDKLKTRIKKDMTVFKDGCNDHTTGLGTAVFGLYYNYIVNEEPISQ